MLNIEVNAMSLEAIKMVSDAEQYAQNLRADTQVQIRKIKADSERDGREKLDLAVDQASEEAKRLMAEAEKKADVHANEILRQSQQDGAALKERASANLDQAVGLIVERIVIT